MDSELKMSADGYTVSRNGVTMSKPDWMSDDYWFEYEAPRVGKNYSGRKSNVLYGENYEQPTHGVEERGEGCDGGACAI